MRNKNSIQLFCFLLVVVILAQPLGRLYVFFSFKINQDYIARVLCENKNRPELHCNGECVLMQKLKKLDERKSEEKAQLLSQMNEILYTTVSFSWETKSILTIVENLRYPTVTVIGDLQKYASKLHKPPKVYPHTII